MPQNVYKFVCVFQAASTTCCVGFDPDSRWGCFPANLAKVGHEPPPPPPPPLLTELLQRQGRPRAVLKNSSHNRQQRRQLQQLQRQQRQQLGEPLHEPGNWYVDWTCQSSRMMKPVSFVVFWLEQLVSFGCIALASRMCLCCIINNNNNC